MEYANWFVVVMGVGIVFFGLIILIIAVTIMGKILGNKANAAATANAGAIQSAAVNDANRALASGETCSDASIVAAIAAAVADDMGTDVSAIKIHSIRKVA